MLILVEYQVHDLSYYKNISGQSVLFIHPIQLRVVTKVVWEKIFSMIYNRVLRLSFIWVISPIIDKRLYLTLFNLATTS